MATNLPFKPGDLVKITDDPEIYHNIPPPKPKPQGNGFPQPGEYILIVDTSFEGKSPSVEVWKVDYLHEGRMFNIIESTKTIVSYLKKAKF